MILTAWFGYGIGAFGNRDFIGGWAVSRLVQQGHAELTYDSGYLSAQAHQWAPGSTTTYNWRYPPTALLLYWPLGFLPVTLSWAFYVICSTGLLALLARKIADHPLALWATLTCPAVVINSWVGQNGACNALFMGLALHYMKKHPFLSGISGALLACKPHLAVLLLLVELIHCRKALVATLGMMLGMMVVVTLVTGFPLWDIWIKAIFFNDIGLENGVYGRMASIFGIARFAGLGVARSWLPHAFIALITAGILLALWRKKEMPFDIKAAALPFATLLFSPYLFYYDYVLVIPGLAFWMRHITRHGKQRREFRLMALIWIIPLWVATYDSALHLIPLPQATLLAALVFLLRHKGDRMGSFGVRSAP